MAHTYGHITSTHSLLMLQLFNLIVACVAKSCFKQDAHEMMMLMLMSCYDHAQKMPKCKANTWGVTALPPYKNLVPRFGKRIIFDKRRGKLLANNLPVPTLHLSHYGYST
jgi:hypothetical protein